MTNIVPKKAGKRRKWELEQRQEIVREFVISGMTVGEVLKKYSLVPSVFVRWRDELEKKIRKEIKAGDGNPTPAPAPSTAVVVVTEPTPTDPKKEMKQQIVARLAKGEKASAIAQELGVSVSRVQYYKGRMRDGAQPTEQQQLPAHLQPGTIGKRILDFADGLVERIMDTTYTSKGIRPPNPEENATITLWHMLHGRI